MIEAISAVVFLSLFSLWNRNDWYNAAIKVGFLLLGLALAFEALTEFGYLIKV